MSELSVQLYTVREYLAQDFERHFGEARGVRVHRGRAVRAPQLRGRTAERAGSQRLDRAHDAHALWVKIRMRSFRWQPSSASRPSLSRTWIRPAGNRRPISARLHRSSTRQQARRPDHGLRVGYHNHHFELESKISGVHGLEVLADRLAPEVVLEVDTYWAYAGGADVPALITRLGDRVVALHLKDGDGSLDPTKQVPVGTGVLPVWDIIAAAPDALRVVELDDSETDLLEAVRAGREFLLAGRA